ncbi:beta-mannosidase [Flavobacterium sp.]|uniref:beta-mannosidase n=1 Tax=Flavobacterium sp. TaxID=239 RepID=UPI002B4AE586|nr:glycoside hydrolase family 2 protein [Flavobacterium sp.]HLP65647.1 glycoside hydrolase family 2 protein [Flavobacterium sp.]
MMHYKRLVWLILFLISNWVSGQKSERDLSSEQWQFSKLGENKWLSATIPGTVHTDLLKNNLIPDPFFGANEKKLQWIEEENWEYQTSFSITKNEIDNQNILLQFDGLDTDAIVYLNNSKILSANNMFRTWKIEVKKLLKVGKNVLRVEFFSSVKKAKEEAKKLSYVLPGDEKVFVRKAQYQFGWDWGPRFVTCGIWKKVSLQFSNSASISFVKYNQKLLTKELAELEFLVQINAGVEGKFKVNLNNDSQEVVLKKGFNTLKLNHSIQNPQLWWTNGLGEAHLYDFKISLSKSLTLIDSKSLKIGLRTIELVQEKDKIGTSFYFKLNGVPVFMKGANYIPTDSFLPKTKDTDCQKIVQNAVDANMNMLRVWGGGVYADDTFYDECDKNGILVWHDFMFACAMYPGGSSFLDNVKQEVIDNVSRLQNHPCIALWCGNNEIDEGWHNWGWQKQYNYSKKDSTEVWSNYKKLFHEVIPKTLDSLLPKTENRYWSSSPSIGWGRKESLLQGDSHYWGVWWGKEPFEVYKKKVGRFMSEYGFQGMPNVKTLQSVVNEDELNLHSESIKNHQKHPTGYEIINEYMQRDYVVPTKFEDYIFVSQLLQADGMKTAIEAHRRAKPNCMGTLYWQLNDCWPVTSWSSVDYYGRWKALHYQVKRSFENLLISFDDDKDNYLIYVINDDLKPINGVLDIVLYDFKGKVVWEATSTGLVYGNSSKVLFEIPKKEFDEFSLNDVVLNASITDEEKVAKSNFYFVKPKELNLSKPTIQITKIDETTIEITSDVLAKDVFLYADEDVFFSDNFFDVLPNQKVIIKLSKPIKTINAKSLFDTLKY